MINKQQNPLKQRILLGLAFLANKQAEGSFDSIFSLHKLTKVPLSKIKQLLNELHEEGAIQLHYDQSKLNEAA